MKFFQYKSKGHLFLIHYDKSGAGKVPSAFNGQYSEIDDLNGADYIRFIKTFREFEYALVGN